MSAALSPVSRALLLRQSRTLLRKEPSRFASTAAETASKAKEQASAQVSKASEGLSRVTSSANSSISKLTESTTNALGRVGGRTGRLIRFVESLIPPTIYYSRVGLELGKLMVQHQKMSPPTIATFQSYFQPLTNAVRNPRTITSALPTGSANEALATVRNTNNAQLTTYAVVLAQVLGFFTVGEMIGRLKIVGYHGEVHHDEH